MKKQINKVANLYGYNGGDYAYMIYTFKDALCPTLTTLTGGATTVRDSKEEA